MKKTLFSFLFLLVSLFAFGLNASVKAVETSADISVEGAQVRTSGNAGLRFVATENVIAQEKAAFGIALAFGETEANDDFVIGGTVNGKEVVSAQVTETNEGTFTVTLYDIPASMYKQKVSARAYVIADDEYIYSEEVCVRSLADVVITAYEAGDESEFVKNVYEAVMPQVKLTTFNYNGGEYKGAYDFVATRYNVLNPLGHEITISYNGGNASYNKYWDRIYVVKTETENVYKVVAVAKTGAANLTIEYDYIIALHANCDDAVSKAAFTAFVNDAVAKDYYLYFNAPTTSTCDVAVKTSLNSKFFFTSGLSFELGENLPMSVKEYYDFVGWYDNEGLEGEAVTAHNGSEVYYAKYTPTSYAITYELNGGSCNTALVETYNYESSSIVLPTASSMSIDGGQFLGWYDNPNFIGEAVTEIPTHSNGDLVFYANWYIDSDTTVELSSADQTAINAITPTIVVSTNFTAGRYVVNGQSYKTGETAFATVVAALAAAEEGDKIYVFAGTYSGDFTATVSNLTLYGPNYNIAGKAVRNAEAVIDGVSSFKASGLTINGLKHTKAIVLAGSNISISYSYITPTSTVACNGQNRKACIVDSANISTLTIDSCYIDAPGTVNDYTLQAMAFNNVSNLTITNNYITNSKQATKNKDYADSCLMTYTSSGVYNINNNEFMWGTEGYLMRIGYSSNKITELNFVDNILNHNNLMATNAGIQFYRISSGAQYNIIGNEWNNVCGSLILIDKTCTNGGNVKVMYNNFAAGSKYKTSKGSAATATITFSNNYYLLAQTTTTSDYNAYTHDAAGLAKMKEDYAAYKAQ